MVSTPVRVPRTRPCARDLTRPFFVSNLLAAPGWVRAGASGGAHLGKAGAAGLGGAAWPRSTSSGAWWAARTLRSRRSSASGSSSPTMAAPTTSGARPAVALQAQLHRRLQCGRAGAVRPPRRSARRRRAARGGWAACSRCAPRSRARGDLTCRKRVCRWMMLEGSASGQTQVDVNTNADISVWATPILASRPPTAQVRTCSNPYCPHPRPCNYGPVASTTWHPARALSVAMYDTYTNMQGSKSRRSPQPGSNADTIPPLSSTFLSSRPSTSEGPRSPSPPARENGAKLDGIHGRIALAMTEGRIDTDKSDVRSFLAQEIVANSQTVSMTEAVETRIVTSCVSTDMLIAPRPAKSAGYECICARELVGKIVCVVFALNVYVLTQPGGYRQQKGARRGVSNSRSTVNRSPMRSLPTYR